MKLIAGNSNLPLAQNIAQHLNLSLTKADITRFADNEVFVEIHENMRGEDIFLIQSTSYPANDHIMELLVILDALKRSSAKRVTAVIPYFGYARQDRKSAPRTPISAKLVSNIITAAGADRVLSLDLHAGQIQGFFDIPVDNLFAIPVFASDILAHFDSKNLSIISPDIGGVIRARSLAQRVNANLAIVDKRRQKAGISEVMHIIGDVKGRDCIIFDDIVDSAGTLCNAAKAIKEKGARSVSAYVTHGVLSGQALEKIKHSVLKNLVITDSIYGNKNIEKIDNIRILSIAQLMAQAIRNIAEETSVSTLFN